jgi:TPR repeat protein
LAYQYGYGFSPSREQALSWFSKAAEQGDTFAIQRRDLFGKPVTTVYRTATAVRPEQVKDDLPAKIAQGMSAPYAGKVGWDELVLHRDRYVGKVINLDFTTVSVIEGSTPYIYVRDPQSKQGRKRPIGDPLVRFF